jgi:hypothetical protein
MIKRLKRSALVLLAGAALGSCAVLPKPPDAIIYNAATPPMPGATDMVCRTAAGYCELGQNFSIAPNMTCWCASSGLTHTGLTGPRP